METEGGQMVADLTCLQDDLPKPVEEVIKLEEVKQVPVST